MLAHPLEEDVRRNAHGAAFEDQLFSETGHFRDAPADWGDPQAACNQSQFIKVLDACVEKLHALACIFQQADDRDAWLRQMDRPVPRLAAHVLPGDATLDAWARQQQQPVALLKRLNPALAGRFSRGSKPIRLLAPTTARPNRCWR